MEKNLPYGLYRNGTTNGQTGIKWQVLSFLWIYLSNPNPKKILQLDFLFYPLSNSFNFFPFKLVQNTFWMAYLGIAFIFLLD